LSAATFAVPSLPYLSYSYIDRSVDFRGGAYH